MRIFLTLLLFAASGGVLAASDPPVDAVGEDTAVLRIEKISKGGLITSVRRMGIYAIDGKEWGGWHPVKWEGQFRLSPGKHTIGVFAQTGGYASGRSSVWFVAEARKAYEVKGEAHFMSYSVVIVDVATGLPVGGIKGSSDEPADAADNSASPSS